MTFKVYHHYNKLADRKQVPVLSCLWCEADLQLLGEEDENGDLTPILHCYYCDTSFVPGINLYEQLREVVIEFYPDFTED